MKRDGLLPRMEARRRADGSFAYRYHPIAGKPIALGSDRAEAVRKVLDINGRSADTGTVSHLWRLYQESQAWRDLAERTRRDYQDYSVPLLKVFGAMQAATLRQQHCRRYMMVERAGKVRANREMALLSNLMVVAVDHGYAESNPVRGLSRIRERPRRTVPIAAEFGAFIDWLRGRGQQWKVIAAMAQFAAKTGARRTEFLRATVFQVRGLEARLGRAKQRDGADIVDVIELTDDCVAMLAEVKREDCTYLFPTRSLRPYTDSGFKAMWSKAMARAVQDKIVTARFTFHDLRAHYATEHKSLHRALPDLHKDPGTTARVYDRSREVKRKAL